MAYSNLRDGDAIITSQGFIFYVFGYEHPEASYHAFLKYVPEELASKFDIDWLDIEWRFKDRVMKRPKNLYTPKNYKRLLEAFLREYPEFTFFSRELDRWIISVSRRTIHEAYLPSRQLSRLLTRGPKTRLEERAVELIRLLSKRSDVPIGFFGIHGSLCLDMSREESDIDISVYGGDNYRRVKGALKDCRDEGLIELSTDNWYDAKRLNKGVYEGVSFIINATRRFSEIRKNKSMIKPLCRAEAECRCIDSNEGVFRPAIYKVSECRPIYGYSANLSKVSQIISMIGVYRDAVKLGERMIVRGVLEEVQDQGGKIFRIVVGSGSSGEGIMFH